VQSKNYQLFKESPKFQLNFTNTNGGNMNAHFYQGNTSNNGNQNSESPNPATDA
jgi:hypothetical protein